LTTDYADVSDWGARAPASLNAQPSTLNPLFTCHSSLLTQLSFVLGGVELPFGFCDQSVFVDLPELIPADSNAFSLGCLYYLPFSRRAEDSGFEWAALQCFLSEWILISR
jgi:hypothetical protein